MYEYAGSRAAARIAAENVRPNYLALPRRTLGGREGRTKRSSSPDASLHNTNYATVADGLATSINPIV
jgi:hypothetical protein